LDGEWVDGGMVGIERVLKERPRNGDINTLGAEPL